MRAHHELAIRRVVDTFKDDPSILAVIVGGSVAKGWEREDSDIDVMLVVSDEEYAQRVARGAVVYVSEELAGYPGGYVDGKVIDVTFLQDAAAHGSETARSAFLGATIAYSRIPSLEAMLARIPVYPEAEREDKIRAFAAHLMMMPWFMGEAEKRQDAYLRTWAATNLVLYGGRLILAYNRLLFPYHKWFMKQLALAPDKPHRLLDLAEAVLTSPSSETANAFFAAVHGFRDWGVQQREAPDYFLRESEWNWRDHRAPLTDW